MESCLKPIIAAVSGYALGGGCEVSMGAARRVFAAETYMGLVEVGVGLIPGGGGTLQVLRHFLEPVNEAV